MQSTSDILSPLDLRGVRVWLSGAVPEPKDEDKPDIDQTVEVWKGTEAENGILAFVQIFAALVLKYGGELVHGCQPSFTPVLLEQSRRILEDPSESPRLHLLVSEYFGTDRNRRDWERWKRVAKLDVTPKTGSQEEDIGPSLKVLREAIASRCNAFVAIGGKWWDKEPGRAGVPIEFEMAKSAGMPCFVLGGFGGIASEYAKRHPDWYEGLGNNLSVEDNQFLAKNTNFSLVAGLIVAQLNRYADGENTAEAQAAN